MKAHIYFTILLVLLSSCNKDLDTKLLSDNFQLKINIAHVNYGDNKTKSDYQWPDGAQLYLHLSNKDNTQTYPATATYSSSSNAWSLSAVQGNLVIGNETKCHVVYLPERKYAERMELDMTNPIYEDSLAIYYLEENTLTITANLSPKTARIRFSGMTGEKIKLYGTSHYTTYTPDFNFFGSSSDEIELEVQDNGFTPYVHAFFPNETKRLEITNSDKKIFVFKCSEQHLEPGTSGFFNIPTEAEHGNWEVYDSFWTFQLPESNICFKMIYVQWINGSYYIAETETTQELWKALTNNNPSYNKSDALNIPVENFSKEDLNEFIMLLQQKTSYPFTVPTFLQWAHAAKGGNNSKGYRYSGSDNLDEVAWWDENSNNTSHPVKEKKANELGLYDMTGNVYECVSDEIFSYEAYGGSYTDRDVPALMLLEAYGWSRSPANHNVGFRLCLNL